MSNSKPIWTKSKWKKSDLAEKKVEIRWPARRGFVLCEVGKFVIGGPNPSGRLFVMIELMLPGRHWSELIQRRYYLPQAAVDRIREHPENSVADFLIA